MRVIIISKYQLLIHLYTCNIRLSVGRQVFTMLSIGEVNIFFFFTLAVLQMVKKLLSPISRPLKKIFGNIVQCLSAEIAKISDSLMSAKNDLVEAVALTVIIFRLLLSGDVELNPGPGKIWIVHFLHESLANKPFRSTSIADIDYDSVDAEQILSTLIQFRK